MSRRSRYIYYLGVLFVLFAGGQSFVKVATDGPMLEAAIDFGLIGLPGLLLMYVGRWIAGTELEPELYPRIVLWCLGGIGVMFVFIVLRAIHPGVETPFSFGTRAIALFIGSIAGLGIGVHEARALARERELNQRNDALKRTQQALERRNRELDRTRADLQETNARLKESNEQLEQFAYAASHDLREPLRMISRYLELLEDRHADSLDDDAREFVAFAVDGAARMKGTIDGLLQYSRIETRGASFESVDLEAVLESVRTDLQVKIDETNAEISVDELPRVTGDESQLRQLFQNLLGNALEYAGDGPPRVRIWAERGDDEHVISVADDGIGIECEDRDRIFEMFCRLHSVDEQSGSGIGLAVCRRIVERHGGSIRVDSEPDEGSTFSVALPSSDPRSVPTASRSNG
ncbi:sensor histidine kinase [Natrarchaeobius oligotrophus]|uniref:histidine kinase n=1 Tax=Natrarchaeobius chitinivorans TaxID=1679083 RepID=A0A3N6MHB2_NATCH|nr:ATP-binding protein [Natrarchaeobius chitinivorans]RQH02498.1 histidine kinase [Natrarchaeobius chitinivorans]